MAVWLKAFVFVSLEVIAWISRYCEEQVSTKKAKGRLKLLHYMQISLDYGLEERKYQTCLQEKWPASTWKLHTFFINIVMSIFTNWSGPVELMLGKPHHRFAYQWLDNVNLIQINHVVQELWAFSLTDGQADSRSDNSAYLRGVHSTRQQGITWLFAYCKGGNFNIHIWAWFGYYIC